MNEDLSSRELFRNRVAALVQQVRAWAEANEWVTKEYPKKMRDANREVFLITALFLQKGPVRVLLDPVAYDVPGSQGVVDLYLMPTYDDLASLFLEDGQWVIHHTPPPNPIETHSAIETQALPLTEQTMNQVLDSIAAHAAPSF